LARFLSVKAPAVGDDGAAALDVGEIGLQRRRVHGHQHVGSVARGEDLPGGELNLIAGDAEQGASRGAVSEGIAIAQRKKEKRLRTQGDL
jgi:hypothetical protein